MQIVVIITKNQDVAKRVWEVCEELDDCLLLWQDNLRELKIPSDALFLLDVDTIKEDNTCFKENNVVCLKSSLKDTKRTTSMYKKGAMDVKQSSYPHILKSTISFYLEKLKEGEAQLA